MSALISPTSLPPTPNSGNIAPQIAGTLFSATPTPSAPVKVSSPQVSFLQPPPVPQPRVQSEPARAPSRPGPVSSPTVAYSNAPVLGHPVASLQLRPPPIPRPTSTVPSPPIASQVHSPKATALAPSIPSSKPAHLVTHIQPTLSSQMMPPPTRVPQLSASPPIPGSGLRPPSTPARTDRKVVPARPSSPPQTVSDSVQTTPTPTSPAAIPSDAPLHSKSAPASTIPPASTIGPPPPANVIDLTQDDDVEMVAEPTPVPVVTPQPINRVPTLADRLFEQSKKAPEPHQQDQMDVDVPPPPLPPPMPVFPKDSLDSIVASLKRKAQKYPCSSSSLYFPRRKLICVSTL